jgi:hypothetical protein
MAGIYEAAEMGSGTMIYIPSLVEIGSGIQKLIWGYTDSMEIAKAHFNFFQNKESRQTKDFFPPASAGFFLGLFLEHEDGVNVPPKR